MLKGSSPEALTQQKTVSLCQLSPLTVLVTEAPYLEHISFDALVGTVLRAASSVLKV
jgi:hypothetical protein